MKTLEKQNADLVSSILVAEPFQPELRKSKGDGRARQAQFGASGAIVGGGIAAGTGAAVARAHVKAKSDYRAKIGTGKVVWRGAPEADPAPVARDHGAVYVTPNKWIARVYAGDKGKVSHYAYKARHGLENADWEDGSGVFAHADGGHAVHNSLHDGLAYRIPVGGDPNTPNAYALRDNSTLQYLRAKSTTGLKGLPRMATQASRFFRRNRLLTAGVGAGAGAITGLAAEYGSHHRPGMTKSFDEARHPRGAGGKFASGSGSTRGRAIIAALPDRVRFGSPAPSMRSAQDNHSVSSPPIRSPMRNSSVWRTGSKLPGLPREYTGSPNNERTSGTFEHIELRQQIPRKMPVADHMDRLRHLSDTIRDSRAEILANADKNRKGKKHVYLKSNEAATKRLYGGVAQWRMKPDLYPEGTPKASLNRAYNHGAMLALHDFGLVHYDFKMDDHLKNEMTPLIPMIRYVRRSLGHKLAIAAPGQNHQYINEFGKPYADKRTHRVGPMAGKPRLRVAPREQLVKGYGAALGALGRRVGASVSHGLNSAADGALSGKTPNVMDRISHLAARRATSFGPGDLKGAARGFGHAIGSGAAAVIHHPVKTAKSLIREGADFGAHLGSGVAEGYGAGPKGVRRSAKVGAAIGATKIAAIPAAFAYHPAVRVLAAMRARRNQQAKPGANP